MKQRILIVLCSVVLATCYGQDEVITPHGNRGLNSNVVENFTNYSALGFTQLTADEDSYSIIRSTLGIGGFSTTITTNKGSFIICQSIGQTSAIGTYKTNDYTFMQGFQQPLNSSKIFQLALENELLANLYPNPFSHYVNISFNDPITNDVFVQVTDITGKTIYTNRFPASQLISLSLNHIPYGVYVLKVVTGNKQFRANLIKQYQ